ncbi:LuxR C-terminal-related transcriptional regulator [Kitasatospora sp. NPDC059577]|uniref:LuxR C-terminal-related transcriptional regulator n=1 Tax=unclassified Kitasatospora TaxID=2633591 RepID=UPI00369340A8
MLRNPDADLGKIAGSLGWDENGTAAQIAKLADLGLLRPSCDAPDLWYAVSPEVGLQDLLARQRVELARSRSRIEEGNAALQVLRSEFADRRLTTMDVEEFTGTDTVCDQVWRLSREARHEVLAFVPGGPQPPESLATSRAAHQDLRTRGVEARSIYLNTARNDPATRTHLRWLQERGVEVRTVALLPPWMILFDQEHALLSVDPDDVQGKAAILLSGRGTAAIAALASLFDQSWQQAAPFGAPVRERDPGAAGVELAGDTKAVLQLLHEGYTDEQAGRKLGISSRTVGRIAGKLMTRLGARSRFQAGALASREGWLDQ